MDPRLRAALDQMWADPECRRTFEQYTGYEPEQAATDDAYALAFAAWVSRKIEETRHLG